MKTQKINTRLNLNKTTIATLADEQQLLVKGGYYATRIGQTCYTWSPVCPTLPLFACTKTCACPTIDTV